MSVKILHLIGQMDRGGAERQLLYLTQELRGRGWQETVVTFNPGSPWDSRLVAIGVPLLGIRRHPNKLWRLWQLSRIVQRENPTLIHSWSNHTNVYGRWFLSYPTPRRIFTFRNDPRVINGMGNTLRRVPNAGVYSAADCVISNSTAALECASSAGVKFRRREVINNIVIAHGRAKPGSVVDVPRIAAAGSLVPLKAYHVLLRALGQLAADGHRFEFLLAGEGPERPRLEQLAAHLNIMRQVRFLGGIEDVPEILSSAHLLVHPSRSEGLSNTILEAMAEGLPVVATNVGGTPEVIRDGKTGLLVPPDKPDLLASKIRQMLENPRLREKVGKAAFAVVRDKYNTSIVATQYERIYRSVAMQ